MCEYSRSVFFVREKIGLESFVAVSQEASCSVPQQLASQNRTPLLLQSFVATKSALAKGFCQSPVPTFQCTLIENRTFNPSALHTRIWITAWFRLYGSRVQYLTAVKTTKMKMWQVAPPAGLTISTHTLFSQPRFLPPPPIPPPHLHAPAPRTWRRGSRGLRGPWLLGTVELLLLVKMDCLMWNSANWLGFWFMAKWVLQSPNLIFISIDTPNENQVPSLYLSNSF